jgi:transcriptional regulator with XRE-family HTH domain
MREKQRTYERRKLDMEMRYFRMAAKEKRPTPNLLCTVRKVLGVPLKEIAQKMGVNRSVIFRMEQGEERGSISMNNMVRVAEALGCYLVYGLVPMDGETLEHMASKRLWEKLLGKERGEALGNRE